MSWLSDELRKIKLIELKYEKLALLIGAVIGMLMMLSPSIADFLAYLIGGMGGFGYLGAFLAGCISSFGITLPPAIAVLYVLGDVLPPWAVAVVAATGSLMIDIIMFELARRHFSKSFMKVEHKHPKLSRWMHRFAPLLVGLVIASPLPDEVVVSIVGAMRFDEKEFIVMVWFVHFLVFFGAATTGSLLI